MGKLSLSDIFFNFIQLCQKKPCFLNIKIKKISDNYLMDF